MSFINHDEEVVLAVEPLAKVSSLTPQLSRNETGVVLLMLRKEQKEAGVLSETRTRSVTT